MGSSPGAMQDIVEVEGYTELQLIIWRIREKRGVSGKQPSKQG